MSGEVRVMEAGSSGTVALGGGTVGFTIGGKVISYASVNPVLSGTPTVSGDNIFSVQPTFNAETGILSYSLNSSATDGKKATIRVTAKSAYYSNVDTIPVFITVGASADAPETGTLTMGTSH